jgi:hypothetical protein
MWKDNIKMEPNRINAYPVPQLKPISLFCAYRIYITWIPNSFHSQYSFYDIRNSRISAVNSTFHCSGTFTLIGQFQKTKSCHVRQIVSEFGEHIFLQITLLSIIL